MMNIFINGQTFEVTSSDQPECHPANVSDALSLYITDDKKNSTYAVALNGTFVSKQAYNTTLLKQNDALDVLFPIVGG